MSTKIQIRRDTAANWSNVNPVLLPGEMGLEIDTLKIKIGPATPGGTNWNDILVYSNVVPEDLNSTLESYVPLADIGASGGVVGLNNSANAIIPGDSIIIEGSDANSYETTLQITEPTADRTITIPNVNGTLVTTGDSGTVTNTMLAGSIANSKLTNSSVTINGYEISLGGTAEYTTDNINEGTTQLYFTNERAQDAVGNNVGNGLSYNDASGAISVNTSVIQAKVSGVSDTEIGYLDGVTSGIQGQLDLKADLAAPTFTGDMAAENLTLSGNLIVNGTNTILNTDTLQVEDNQIILNSNVTGAPSLDAFVTIKRGTSNDVYIKWNESTDAWEISSDGTNVNRILIQSDMESFIGTHNSDTTNVHGILDTSALATQSDITNHNNETTNIHGIADTASLATFSDISTHNLDTTNVHGIADTSVLATQSDITTHNSDTTNVHGIADTSALATQSDITTHNNETTNVHGIGDTSLLATQSDITTHNSDTTNVHGIADTSALAMQSDITTHNSDTTNVHGIADTSLLATNLDVSDAITSHNTDTTGVHGIADTSALATKIYADNSVDTHNNHTTNIHGIADTSALALTSDVNDALALKQDKVSGVSDTEIGYLDGVTSGIQSQINSKASSTDLSDHNSDTTSVHGIADTSLLVTTTGTQTLSNKTLESPTVTVSAGVSFSMNTGYLDSDGSSGTAYTFYDDQPGFSDFYAYFLSLGGIQYGSTTGPITITGVTSGGYISGTNTVTMQYMGNSIFIAWPSIAYQSGATFISPTIGWGGSTVNISATEISYLDGVTSNIQTQLNAKASSTDLSNHNSDTTSVHGISDTSKLVTKDALSTTLDGDLTISGDLIVSGSTTTVSATDLVVSDPLIYIGEGNDGNAVDLGIVSSFNDGTYQHAGIVRDASDNKWKLFKGVIDEPTTTVNFTQGSLDALAVGAFEATSAIIGNVSNTEIQYLDGVTSSIQTQLDSKISSSTAASTYETISNVNLKAPIADPTFTGLVTLSSSGIAFSDGTQTKQGVPSQTYIYGAANSNAFTSNTTLSNLAYRDTLIEVESTSGVTITIPADNTTNFPIGTSIDILQTNTGQVTIAGDGFTPNATPGLKLRTRWSSCTLQKRGPNSWVVFGDLTA